ncbi:MAG: hypothetical protein IV090_24845 [Candidatus Sericytochromatia bacterium]|nr:hypothetical protein [Candidatus Sericytochromatia bacterium]
MGRNRKLKVIVLGLCSLRDLKVAAEGNPLNLATSRESILTYLQEKGLQAKALNGDLQTLLAEIHQAKPVMVLLDFGGLGNEHYVLVVGYHPAKGENLIHDSIAAAYRPLPLKQFLIVLAKQTGCGFAFFWGAAVPSIDVFDPSS